MPRIEGELVEVVFGRLDLSVVANLVAEADESVFDLAASLRDRVHVAERKLVTGERDVDNVLGLGPVELGALELRLPRLDRLLDRLACGVQRHAGLAVTYLAKRELEVAAAAEIPDAKLVQVAGRGGGL